MDFNEIEQNDLIKMIGSIKIDFLRIIKVKDFLIELKLLKLKLFKKAKENLLINFQKFFKHYTQKLKKNFDINLYEFKFTYNDHSWK